MSFRLCKIGEGSYNVDELTRHIFLLANVASLPLNAGNPHARPRLDLHLVLAGRISIDAFAFFAVVEDESR